ncbi:hypothetical protein BGW39_010248 [Mortierella sp. 14UC]|nr:hypothetical protein BGW39_010248 [Mortierella sp. 14UC]
MTSQPLVASFYVDYLSHPLSSEHLLVCYQQITRQIGYAPLSAKDAAISFQHQSQAMIELLGQHQTLAIPQTKERPAPVACQAQLKRMQNALWRRSSQSSLAKDVALVRPESLNWQKECDVLWLYGPLYNAAQPNAKQQRQEQCDWTNFSAYSSPPRRASSPLCIDGLNTDIETLAIANESRSVTPEATEVVKAKEEEEEEKEEKAPEAPVSPPTAIETQPSPAALCPSSESVSPDAVVAVDTAVSISTDTTTSTIDASNSELGADDAQATAFSSTESVSISPLQIDTSAVAAVKDGNDNTSLSSSPTVTSSPVDENALLSRPKSALKQLGTMSQTFEELRSFTQTPQYLALANALASFSLATSTTGEGAGSLVAYSEGTRSEPMSPTAPGGNSATFLLPIFSSPTKFHFRSHDQRRASFPKSASHPSQLNVNINLNMNVFVHSTPATTTGRRATIGGASNICGHHHRGGRLVPSASAKQLRFSLEVQELIFLPTSPPFRISRAKPTRAHSDPAIQTTTCSSFIAPQLSQQQQQDGDLSPALQHSLHRSGLISSTTASAASFENMTTTFTKVRASSRSGGKMYLPEDEDRPECHFNNDRYYYEDCREASNGCGATTDEEYDDDDEFDVETEDDDDEDLEDDEFDEFNGLGRKRTGTFHSRPQRRRHGSSRRYRLSSKDAIVARRASGNDTTHPGKAAGMLWQVYTAVTGVKELITWYGSMVYHSSSL